MDKKNVWLWWFLSVSMLDVVLNWLLKAEAVKPRDFKDPLNIKMSVVLI